MTWALFGFLCLWLLSVGRTERSVDNGVVSALFSWIDGQHEQNNNASFEEYGQAWTSCDKNNDSYLSKEEVRAAVEQLQIGNNSYIEDIFGNQNFSYGNPLKSQFKKIDNSSDGFVLLSEFRSYYDEFVPILDQLDRLKEAMKGGRSPFSFLRS